MARTAAMDETEAAADRQFVAALARGLDILDCFDASGCSLSVSEIAMLLGLPQPTVWRLCHTMLSLGYLTATEGGRVQPALAVLRLGYATLSELPVPELARPYLQELADRFNGAAGMAVRDGLDMRFVQRCESDSQLVLNLRIGSRVPIVTSAMGWAYLAGLPAAARIAVAQPPEVWQLAEPVFRRALEGFVAEGFIINPGVLHPGYNTAAVPVMGADGLPRFTLNCGGAASVLSLVQLRTDVGPKLRTLAGLIAAVA
ncbi:IclR family transcriptional regulator [Acidisphaera sp. L21]|uniref:IclR family transcriptional regulator n=1 Tax=Acidisphaera sp. L21 TaxID=1641851 RepID=UPI00131DE8A2|nr:IclR family transcriptional regulator [Acidisphaera sp. L21]